MSAEPLAADQLTVALVLDTAEDIDRSTLLAQQGAAVEFVLQLDPRSPVVIANTVSGVVAGPSTDRRLALEAIQDLTRDGPRQASVSLGSVLDAAASSGAARLAMVVVSGGADSSDDGGASVRTRLSGGITLQWIAAAEGGEPPAALADVATVTASSDEELLPLLDVVAASMVGQYRLRFRLDEQAVDVQIELTADTASWRALVPLPALPDTAPTPTTVTGPATSAAPVPTTAADPATSAPTTVAASTSPASIGPPAPSTTADAAGDETASVESESDGSSFPILLLVAVLLLIIGLGALFMFRNRLQPSVVRPTSPGRQPRAPARAAMPAAKRGRQPASKKTVAKAPPAEKQAAKQPPPGKAPSPQQAPPKTPPQAPVPRPPGVALPPPTPAGIPVHAGAPREPRPLPPPAEYALVVPRPEVARLLLTVEPATPAPDDGLPRVSARPIGSYRPSRSVAKPVTGEVRPAGPYLQR